MSHRSVTVRGVILILGLTLAGCGGSTAQSIEPSVAGSPTARPSTSTELVGDFDVGGRKMHLVCVGPTDSGEPTVLLESGGGMDYSAWGEILPVMESTHRLCAYDRAGLGTSDPPSEASRLAPTRSPTFARCSMRPASRDRS